MDILLADDHAIVRSGLRRILADAFPNATVGEVGSCRELLERVREKPWSLLILDIALEDRNSLELVPQLKHLRPRLPIIVLSMYGEWQFVIRALRSGVSAYLTKDRAPEELLKAVQNVLQGKRYLSEGVALELADRLTFNDSGAQDPHKLLSPREYEVFLLLASARSVSEVASRLDLSVKTVSTYRTRILEKMGLGSNAELMRYALQHGLVS